MIVSRSYAPLAPLLLVLTVACGTDREPTVPQNMRPVLNAGQGVTAHASGGGIVDFSAAGAGYGHFAFSATVHGDGSVAGHFRQRRERNGLVIDFSGRVTCLTVDAALHRARIGGVITENNSTDPAFLTPNHDVGVQAHARRNVGTVLRAPIHRTAGVESRVDLPAAQRKYSGQAVGRVFEGRGRAATFRAARPRALRGSQGRLSPSSQHARVG